MEFVTPTLLFVFLGLKIGLSSENPLVIPIMAVLFGPTMLLIGSIGYFVQENTCLYSTGLKFPWYNSGCNVFSDFITVGWVFTWLWFSLLCVIGLGFWCWRIREGLVVNEDSVQSK